MTSRIATCLWVCAGALTLGASISGAQVAPSPDAGAQPDAKNADDAPRLDERRVKPATIQRRMEAIDLDQAEIAARIERNFPSPPIDPALLEMLVEDLGADDPTTRDLATRRLQTEPGVSFEQIESMAQDLSAPPERRRRLLRVARALFVRHPKAGLGVQFDNGASEQGIAIARTVDPERFPAAAILREGDIITSADGVPIRSMDQARAIILSHDANGVLPVVIIREGETLELDLPLGAYEDLAQGTSVSASTLDAAWRERRRRWEYPDDTPAIGAGLGAADWQEAGAESLRLPPQVAPVQGVAAGGRSQSEPGAVAVGHPVEFIGAVARRPGAGFETMSPEQRRQQYARLSRDLANLEIMRARDIQRLQDRAMTPEDQQAVRDRIRALNARRLTLERELERLVELGGFDADASRP